MRTLVQRPPWGQNLKGPGKEAVENLPLLLLSLPPYSKKVEVDGLWHLMLEMTSNVAQEGGTGQARRRACVEMHLVDKTESCFAIPCSEELARPVNLTQRSVLRKICA